MIADSVTDRVVQGDDRPSINYPRGSRWAPGLIRRLASSPASHGVEMLFVGILLAGVILSPAFLSPFNIRTVLFHAAIFGTLAIGQYIVIVSGGFDLSVGAVAAVGSVIVATMIGNLGLLAMAVAILCAGLLGALSGAAVTIGRIPPIVATLAVLGIGRGVAYGITHTGAVIENEIIRHIGNLAFGPIPLLTVVWVAVVCLVWLVMRRTALGTYLFAVGGDMRSARLAGVPVGKVKLTAFVLSGCTAGLAGVMFAARSTSGIPSLGAGWELGSIAAVVIGGVSLYGGSGTLPRAMLGVMSYLMITNVMTLAGVQSYVQNVLMGAVILGALVLPTVWPRARGLPREGRKQ